MRRLPQGGILPTEIEMNENQANGVKAAAVWSGWGVGELLAGVGISSWGEAASAAAFILSCLFIIDWFWKKWKSKGVRDESDGE